VKLRLLAVLAAIGLYGAGVLTVNSVVLPAAGINGVVQVNTETFDFLGPAHPSDVALQGSDPHAQHTFTRMFDIWLRPFGVHRPDVNDVWWSLGAFAVLASVATMLLFLFPKRLRYVSRLLRDEPISNHVLNFVLGTMAYALAYALLRLSWLTIVGMPFIPFLIGGVWLITMGGIVAVSFTLGRAVLRRVELCLSPLAEALIGLWLLFVTSMLPVVGWIAGGIAAATGFGALLQTHFGSRQRWSLELLDEPPPDMVEPNSKILPLRRVR
jgi:hypothetical protein